MIKLALAILAGVGTFFLMGMVLLSPFILKIIVCALVGVGTLGMLK